MRLVVLFCTCVSCIILKKVVKPQRNGLIFESKLELSYVVITGKH